MFSYSATYGQSTTREEAGCVNTGNYTNVNCFQNLQNEKNGVVKIEIPISGGCDYCTGVLLNTTANENNSRHFLLTARHCLQNNNPNLSDWKFYWHYESPTCSNSVPPQIYTIGAKVVAKSKDIWTGDFALLELDHDPAEEWDVTPYYLGWDRSGNKAEGTLIYHPDGDIKKILNMGLYHEEATMYSCNGSFMYAHWRISTAKLELKGGSSGAPLLCNSKVIGHIMNNICMASYNGGNIGYYWDNTFGKLRYAWEGDRCNVDSSGRLKDWLDPLNTGVVTLDGRGVVCQQTIRLHKSIPRSNYHAVQDIISKQTIPKNTTTSYKAGTEIKLQNEFHANQGSTFHAQIEQLDCNNTKSTSFFPQGDEYLNDIMEDPNLSSSQLKIQPNSIYCLILTMGLLILRLLFRSQKLLTSKL